MNLIFNSNIQKWAVAACLFRYLCAFWEIRGLFKLLKFLLKKFKSGLKDLSVEISRLLSKGLNFSANLSCLQYSNTWFHIFFPWFHLVLAKIFINKYACIFQILSIFQNLLFIFIKLGWFGNSFVWFWSGCLDIQWHHSIKFSFANYSQFLLNHILLTSITVFPCFLWSFLNCIYINYFCINDPLTQ